MIVGVSFKTYFGHRAARDWLADAADVVSRSSAVAEGAVEFFVAPTYPQLIPAMEAFAGTRAAIAAQDVSAYAPGAFTGEVAASELAEIGVRMAEIGHAERRRLFGDTDEVIAAKTAAALHHGLTPLLCVGEPQRLSPADALAIATQQVEAAIDGAPDGRIIVAYEPVWAIGAPEPAPAAHTAEVCAGLRDVVCALPGRGGSAVIYGGSAGPGLLTELAGAVDGVFLGRFAHDPAALAAVLDEAATLAR
ncbi:triose-phosphate isomerase [Salinibacterium sp. ZJ70]|uniref:triose-phosphate isomerase family protein n=1 Tax=Salinibacterium sp. ZJ70 TaxID=2708084 RepID=UPI00351C4961